MKDMPPTMTTTSMTTRAPATHELERQLRTLSLSGMAQTLLARNQQAISHHLAYTEFLESATHHQPDGQGVVDDLEVVEIDEQYRGRTADAASAGERMPESVHQQQAIRQFCERVMKGPMG